ncbi:MAG TPA: hypothetical protein PLY56_13960, partial [Armatimonadota bacterium]|nr:hypothetical protein [Armatimonadota bacterium]
PGEAPLPVDHDVVSRAEIVVKINTHALSPLLRACPGAPGQQLRRAVNLAAYSGWFLQLWMR